MFKRLIQAAGLLLCCAQFAPVALAVPVVAITAPANNATYTPPAAVTLTANATDSASTISKVEFFNGTTLIGTVTAAPYTFNWSNVATGKYTIKAKATNSSKVATTSSAITITVNNPPTVTLTAPANAASFAGVATVNLSADAADADGTITKVDFYRSSTLIGTATAAPYAFTWTNVQPGSYSITAKATDNLGRVTTSSAAGITVTNPITVAISAPANNTKYIAPAAITLSATASDIKGTISKVQFYNGATLLGSVIAAPYTFKWNAVPPGSYQLTAKATDTQNLSNTSSPINVTVAANAAPAVTLIAPAANVSYSAPATIALSANATDGDGTISKVEFYNGTTLLGTVTAAPYTFNWKTVPIGTYSITAKATDNLGAITTSTAVPVKVIANAAPIATLVTPTNNTKFIARASINLTATATPAAGNSIKQVDYYNGANFIGMSTTAPYGVNWSGVLAGSYALTAKATDTLGQSGTSAIANITVANNLPPSVTLSATPLNATAPATITLSATATDSDGSIAKVEYFNGASLLATVTTPPYTFNWRNVAAGRYSVTAKATDNLNASTTSTSLTINVAAQVAQIYYVHNDQINTPRTITDNSGNVVWEWKNDPFGAMPPNENPSNLGNFTFNPRMPGQYYDKETNLFYNGYRDLDPSTGRYLQSDLIGLEGGINTYAYAGSNPISNVDPNGLQAIPIPLPLPAPGGMSASVGDRGGYDPKTDMYKPGPGSSGDQCCSSYTDVYEPNDGKHGSTPRGNVSAEPSNPGLALATSVGVGKSRIGYDGLTGQIVIFRNHWTDERKCIKYWHGYVVYQRDLDPDQWKAGRDAGFPNWPRKPK